MNRKVTQINFQHFLVKEPAWKRQIKSCLLKKSVPKDCQTKGELHPIPHGSHMSLTL